MDKSEIIEINGVVLTPEIMDTLKFWQSYDSIIDSIPEAYLRMLGDAQDVLIKAMSDYDSKNNNYDKSIVDSMITSLKDLIMIKEDLKKLSYKK